MKKSKLAIICMFTSLGLVLLNILILILAFKSPVSLETISVLYRILLLLAGITVISSIVSLVRVAISKKQLKGTAQSVIAVVLSIFMLIGGYFQWVFVSAMVYTKDMDIDDMISEETNNYYDEIDGVNIIMPDFSDNTEEDSDEETGMADMVMPEVVKKDFDTVAVVHYYDLGKSGYIDKEGDLVIEAKFDDAKDFYEGLAPVRVGDKWGYIDKTGEFVIEPQFEKADIFSSGVAAVMVDDKWGYIDKTGKFVIPPSQDEPTRFSEGLALFVDEEIGKVGYVDTTGKFVIKPEYDYGEQYFLEGYVTVVKDFNNLGSTWGIVDKKGNFLSMPVDSFHSFGLNHFSEGLYPACKEGEEFWGYVDHTGEYVIEPKFLKCFPFSEGLAEVVLPGGDLGYIDKEGNTVIRTKFDLVYPFSEGLALVNVDIFGDKSCGYIDRTGNFVIKPQFAFAENFSQGLALVRFYEGKMLKEGFIDKTGEFVIGPTEDVSFGSFRRVDGVFDPRKVNSEELRIY